MLNTTIHPLSNTEEPAAWKTDEVVAGFPVLVEIVDFPMLVGAAGIPPAIVEPAPPPLPATPEIPDGAPVELACPENVAPSVVLFTEFETGHVVVYKALD